MQKAPEIGGLKEEIRKGNRAALAKGITLIESFKEQDRIPASQLLSGLLPFSGKSIRLGITGVPGCGKSTFIEAYGQFLSDKGHKVGVLAVDPSSQLSKGSILGDKTRMERLSTLPNVFIRPSPSSGSFGGLNPRTREAILLMEAAGFDYIIIETVGVGQSETTVRQVCDFFLLLMLAGAGDELQGIKRGIMEMADGIAITKADGDNLKSAQAARGEYNRALKMISASDSGWESKVSVCSALKGQGIKEISDEVGEYHRSLTANGKLEKIRKAQELSWFDYLVLESARENILSQPTLKIKMETHRKWVENREMDVSEAVLMLFQKTEKEN